MSHSIQLLVTLGPTHEPIDAVRYVGNRSSGRMGAAIVAAGCDAGHRVTAICGPTATPIDVRAAAVVRVTTARQMFDAVSAAFADADVLIMSAAVADFRPARVVAGKLPRDRGLTLDLEPTDDIVAHVSRLKRPDQRTVAFSLERADAIERARAKMRYKHVDLMVFNPLETMDAGDVRATLLWPDGRSEAFDAMPKDAFARVLVDRATR